jgi:hypothetical protein
MAAQDNVLGLKVIRISKTCQGGTRLARGYRLEAIGWTLEGAIRT